LGIGVETGQKTGGWMSPPQGCYARPLGGGMLPPQIMPTIRRTSSSNIADSFEKPVP
jgi:hypothetical protein